MLLIKLEEIVNWIEGHTLYHPEDVKFIFDKIPDVFTTFRKIERNCDVRDCISAPKKINCPPNLISDDIPDLAEFLTINLTTNS